MPVLSRVFKILLVSLSVFSNTQLYAQSGPSMARDLEKSMQAYPDSAFELALVLKDQVNFDSLEKQFRSRKADLYERTSTVIRLLEEQSGEQKKLLKTLQRLHGVEKASIRTLWINNSIFLRAKQSALQSIQREQAIAWIVPNSPVEIEEHIDEFETSNSVAGVEIGLQRIQAPAMWEMGYTGYGQRALIIDTGVDGTHPALMDRYRGNTASATQSWFDEQLGTEDPGYCDDHGTHVAGTILGLDPNGADTIGVAFGATWMGSPAICNGLSSDNLASFQWALNPDGDPSTIEDMPTVINNSWRATDVADECTHPLYGPALDALEAAGIAVVFSAGNGGPDSVSITPPKNINHSLTNTFTVAAVNGIAPELNVMSFSSRGPSTCPATGSLSIKPEVAAPGFQVRSAILGGGYGRKSGTSMAAPHVAGAILLLKEAFPYLTGTEIKEALYFSCQDLGVLGEDNEYGMGLIDVFAAFQYLENSGNVPVSVTSAYDPGIVRIGGFPSLSCDSVFQPYLEIVNKGTEDLTSLKIAYQYSTGLLGTVWWSGQIGTDSLISIDLPITGLPTGSHSITISLEEINGGEFDYHFLDNEGEQSFLILPPLLSTESPIKVCQGADGLLSGQLASEGTIRWFETQNASSPVYEGDSWFFPQPGSNQTYFASAYYRQSIGEEEIDLALGEYAASTDGALIFDCQKAFSLTSVQVFSQSDGYRTIELRDEEGTLLDSHTEYLNIGVHRVLLDFEISPGKGWQLGLAGQGGLFRQMSGSQYPYEIPGIMRIARSSQGKQPYYYFFDWQIEYESPCGRQQVDLELLSGQMQTVFSIDTLSEIGSFQFLNQNPQSTNWQWDFGDGSSSNEANPIHTYQTIGSYRVSLFAIGPDGCGDAFSQEIQVDSVGTTGIWEEEENEQFTVFPNPTTGRFQLSFQKVTQKSWSVECVDMLGNRIWQSSISPGQKETFFDLQGYPAGMYLLQLKSPTQMKSLPVVKQNN